RLAMCIPTATYQYSAMNLPTAEPSAAAPSNRVVMSSDARSSASALRTSSKPNGSANRQHPIDGPARPESDVGGNRDLELQVAQRVPQVLERDHLHVAALRLLGDGIELLAGILAP